MSCREKLGLPALLTLPALLAGAAIALPAPAAPAPPATPPGAQGEAPASALGAPPASGESFDEAIEVKVVNVGVVVRDRSGQLVSGLARDDFSLFVDGKRVEITNFSSPLPPPPSAAAAQPSPGTPAEEAPARERLSLVIFVDNANLRPFDRNRLLKQLRGFLDKTLGPGDQVLVVAHDQKGLHVRHAFADSRAALAPALDKLEKESAAGIDRDLDLRNTVRGIYTIIDDTNGCQDAVDQAAGLARAHAARVLADVKATYIDLHNLLDSLDGVAGRKALLYVGDGVPTQVGADVMGVLEEVCGISAHTGFGGVDATAPMRQVIADANASHVTIFTLEATGQASYISPDPGGLSLELSRDIDLDRQSSLTSLARETGGRAALNGSDFRHDLDEIGAEIANAYSLGFTPPAGPAGPGGPRGPGGPGGRQHSIKVELRRPGLLATYGAGYRDRSADERLEGVVEAALIHGQVDNPLGATVKVGSPMGDAGPPGAPAKAGGPAGRGDRVTVPLSLRVPFAKLTFLPGEGGRHGHVTIFVAVMDAQGGLAPVQRAQLPLRIPEGDAARKILASQMGYDLKLIVEPGRQRIALAVRDDVARIASSLLQEVEVDKTGKVR